MVMMRVFAAMALVLVGVGLIAVVHSCEVAGVVVVVEVVLSVVVVVVV